MEATVSTRRGSREDRESARRARLLEAGLEVFGTIGYVRSAIESICVDAGVGTHSFYASFASKEELLRAVYDDVILRLATRLEAALRAEEADLESHARGAVRACVDQVTGDERAARVQLLEVVGVSEELERHRREVIHAFADLLREDSERLHAQRLVERPLSPMLAVAAAGGTTELLIDWLVARRRPSRRRLEDELTRFHLALARA